MGPQAQGQPWNRKPAPAGPVGRVQGQLTPLRADTPEMSTSTAQSLYGKQASPGHCWQKMTSCGAWSLNRQQHHRVGKTACPSCGSLLAFLYIKEEKRKGSWKPPERIYISYRQRGGTWSQLWERLTACRKGLPAPTERLRAAARKPTCNGASCNSMAPD